MTELRMVPKPSDRGTPWAGVAWLLVLTIGLACQEQSRVPPTPARVPVRTEVVRAAPFQPTLLLLGELEPASRVEVRAPRAGTIHYPRRFASGLRTGEKVSGGELLFSLESEELRLQGAEAELELRARETELERARQGFSEGFVARALLDEAIFAADLAKERLDSARTLSESLKVSAAGPGVLKVERVIPPGTEVAPGTLLAELAVTGRPRVTAWASASQLPQLAVGQVATLRLPGGRAEAGWGVLREVDREVDRMGTVRVIIEVEEEKILPPPGAGLEVEVRLAAREAAFSLPDDAVLYRGGAAAVFVLEPAGKHYRAQLRQILVGTRGEDRVEILDGLRAEERVAIEGVEFLAEGSLAVDTEEKGI